MSKIKKNHNRPGNFTSSKIIELTKGGRRDMTEDELQDYLTRNPKGKRKTIDTVFGQAAMTYIFGKNMERRLLRSIENNSSSKPTNWGHLCEVYVHEEVLPNNYRLSSAETFTHPEIPEWVGSPDGERFPEDMDFNKLLQGDVLPDSVFDIKCPYTLNSFCNLVDPLYHGLTGMDAINAIRFGWTEKSGLRREAHDDGEKYYTQLISNAAIRGTKYAELIVFAPYRSELDKLRDLAGHWDEGDQNKVAFMGWAADDDVPYLHDGGYYKNINIIRFEVNQDDVKALRDRVLEARKMLIPFHVPVPQTSLEV